jgi:drug/metabolite transporter (DMT)-like permease
VIKEFDITMFAISNNLGPIATVIFAYIFLRDKIKREDMLLLAIVIVGLAIKFSFPQDLAGSKNDVHKSGKSIFGYICLAYTPVGIALGWILMRKMKKVHFIQLSLYKIIIALVVTTTICLIRQESLSLLSSFSGLDWFYLIAGSLFQQGSVIARKIST